MCIISDLHNNPKDRYYFHFTNEVNSKEESSDSLPKILQLINGQGNIWTQGNPRPTLTSFYTQLLE